jgi:hypothetical protein
MQYYKNESKFTIALYRQCWVGGEGWDESNEEGCSIRGLECYLFKSENRSLICPKHSVIVLTEQNRLRKTGIHHHSINDEALAYTATRSSRHARSRARIRGLRDATACNHHDIDELEDDIDEL